jgi:hypothetical protein
MTRGNIRGNILRIWNRSPPALPVVSNGDSALAPEQRPRFNGACRMPQLTRRRDPEAPEECWHIYFGDVNRTGASRHALVAQTPHWPSKDCQFWKAKSRSLSTAITSMRLPRPSVSKSPVQPCLYEPCQGSRSPINKSREVSAHRMLRAQNRNVERVFKPERKDPHWGRRKLTRDQ